ncbi:MAG: hypothetical protein MUF38_01425 [Anaerolineae bacterium]|nr:hypothetical protein [Anaerolineae bacterium]
MPTGIAITDMHIRDERVLQWIKDETTRGRVKISHQTIADQFGCHINTAQRIVARLVAAGHLRIENPKGGRGGFIYRALRHTA